MKNKKNTNKGITLIALIITIIVMLILVSVTISMAVNGGLFEYAGKAVGDTQNAIDKEQTLANGEIKIGDTWYNSMDDYLKGVESVKSLQEKHEFTYYSSLVKAVEDVNNNTRENADAEKETAVAGVYTNGGKTTVVLLKDITEATRVEPKVDMTINLGGKTLSTEDVLAVKCVSGNITIDGRLSGSGIKVIHAGGKAARAIQAEGCNLIVKGGAYEGQSDGCTKGVATISLVENVNATISNATIISTETSKKAIGIISGDSTRTGGVNLTILNCKIMVYSESGAGKGVGSGFENNQLTISDCIIDVSGFNVLSAGVTCSGSMKISSTYLKGTVGISIEQGVGYMNNCDINGTNIPIELNSIEGENNNTLYISNSRINTDKKISIGDNANLYIGKGCNFTAEHTTDPSVVTITDDVYIKEN